MKGRAVGILVENGQAAMIERRRAGKLYYVFPGGHIRSNEMPETAVARELLEELGLYVRVGRLVARSTFDNRPHFYYLVESTGGQFGQGTGKELSRPAESERGSVRPAWLAVADLKTQVVLPEQMARLVCQAAQAGWPEEIAEFIEHESFLE
jgi:8-oxo-dGTP pyrophosphatase MutT (NUDIX family)